MSTIPHDGRVLSRRNTRFTFLQASAGALAGLADAATILGVAVAAGLAWHYVAHEGSGNVVHFAAIGAATAWLYLFPSLYRGDYTVANYLDFRHHPARIFYLWSFSFICLITLAFLAKVSGTYSRGFIVLFYVGGLTALIGVHASIVKLIRFGNRAGLLVMRRVFVVGTEPELRQFLRRHQPWTTGLDIAGTHFLDAAPAAEAPEGGGQVSQRDLDAAVAAARALQPDSVVIAAPWSKQAVMSRCIEAFMTVPASIHLAPEPLFDQFDNLHMEKFGPLSCLHILGAPLTPVQIAIKRSFDLAAATLAVVLLAPLFLAVAAVIKLDSPGPVFFRQTRYGFNRQSFRIWKFRTMRTMEDGPVVHQATRDDPRVTRVGGFLRRWNIDELPQLFNVIAGDMSLVGPRPHALAHDQSWSRNIARYARRHNVKPGITGWAQVNGYRGMIGSEETLKRRIACDLYYIDNWSLWLDLQILVLTVFSPRAYENSV